MNSFDKRLLRFIREPDSNAARLFELIVLILVFYSLLTYSLETLPNLSTWMRSFLDASEVIVGTLFSVEYILRVVLSKRPLGYATSFYGVIDLFSVVPLILGIGFNGAVIRTLRVFRVFRIFKLGRYSKSAERFAKALVLVREDLVIFFMAVIILAFVASVGIYHCEHEAQPDKFQSIFHSMWWAVATLTTVGYGDIFPVTVGGKMFTSFMLACGLGIIAVPAGLIASALTKVREDECD
jgi:voltage-gated potassium channel